MQRVNRLNTLRVRLVVWSMAVNALLLIAFGSGIWLALRQVQLRQIDDTLQLSAAQLAATIDSNNGQSTVSPEDVAMLANRGVFAWIINDTGKADLTTGQAASLPLPTMTADYQNASDGQGGPIRLYRYVLKENGGVLIVGISLGPLQQTLQTVLIILGATIPLALVISALGSIFLAGRALGPITAITAQAKRISRENLSERLGFASLDEVGQLAQTFDSMLDRLQAAFEHEQQFMGNASHELRTPLSMLKAQISLALNRPRDVETLVQMLSALEGDVDRMTRLIERMLALDRVEAAAIERIPVNLSDLLGSLLSQMQPLADERHIALMIEAPTNAWVLGDPDQLVQLFVNLLDNALKYSNSREQVRVNLKSRGSEWQIDVSDTGIGISAEHLPHVFDRFYRADPSRTRQTGGMGLGLAIAKAIVQQHNGRIAVQSQPGHGSVFTVSLPKVSPL
ncbi:MAG: sensor histidine kinase [Aggregatilineales bacterium]